MHKPSSCNIYFKHKFFDFNKQKHFHKLYIELQLRSITAVETVTIEMTLLIFLASVETLTSTYKSHMYIYMKINIYVYISEVSSSALHVALAALHFRQCSGSARYIFK